jgi:glycosyltransferase involved in cell wall biosynthesis
MSGVPRYAAELMQRLGDRAQVVSPKAGAQGLKGHIWEQLSLPRHCQGRLLFSPGNTGPLTHRRQVVTIHDASTFDCPGAFGGAFGRWYRWLLPRLARRALHVITVSEFSRQRLVKHLGVSEFKISVVHNGVTMRGTPPSEDSLVKVRRRLNLGGRFLLFVGSMDPRKNLARLIEAFGRADLPDLTLVVAGGVNRQLFSGSSLDGLGGKIRIVGRVDEECLEALYAMADAFVFPSSYEGFGLPPLEAMARGCPVLCSDSSSLPEVCGLPEDRGGACIYFNPNSVGQIAEAMLAFSRTPARKRDAMVDAGRRRAALFTWDRCATETAGVLDRFR